MAVAVAVKIDKNSLISNKWAAEASCQVCNGILQRSAVPTGARVHPNPITYPDSATFSHYGAVEKPARTQAGFAVIVGCTPVFGRLREAVVLGWGGGGVGGQREGSCAWLGERYEKPEVCFVVGLVSFSGPAGAGEKESQGHKGPASPAFYCPPPLGFCCGRVFDSKKLP